jgi:hypothetical protein
MANVFVVEWDENNQRVRDKVSLGNFDGDVDQAQRALDNLWSSSSPERKNVKVIKIVGAGEVVKVDTPQRAPNNAAADRAPTIREK